MISPDRCAGRFSATVLTLLATAFVATAQPVPTQGSPAPKAAEQFHAAMSDRAKAQVVYNVRSRESAELLHAQSKASPDVSLPIDANMPISLQISRANANVEAAGAARAVQTSPVPVVPRARKSKAQNRAHLVAPPGPSTPFIQSPGRHGHGHGRGKHGE